MKHNLTLLFMFLFLATSVIPASAKKKSKSQSEGQGDQYLLAQLREINIDLANMGLGIGAESVHAFSIGRGRPETRIHQKESRWMPGDARRQDPGFEIRYMIDQSEGYTASGLSNAETEAAIERSFATWESDRCTSKVDLVYRPDPGTDITLFDGWFGFDFGDPTVADIVLAGWLPESFFEAVFGPGGGTDILAFSITYTWVDANRNPTDLNGDNYFDTARNEIYFNDAFGSAGSDREKFPWSIDQAWPGMDVESISLHELGHGLGLGHFGSPPNAVMNPSYRELRQSLMPADHSGACILFASGGKKSK